MMYNLKLPENSSSEIDLSEVLSIGFKGIVLGYKNGNPFYFILKYEDVWYCYSEIDTGTWVRENDDITELLNSLIDSGLCDCFKVIKLT